jgi:hypothetical protein
MPARDPVVIDDIAPALRRLSELGRAVLGPLANAIRNSVLLYAAVKGWRIIHHDTFAAWANSVADDDAIWIVLDPLVGPEQLAARTVHPRFTRALGPQGWAIDETLPTEVATMMARSNVAILDDAAATGTTLRHTIGLVTNAGGSVNRIAVGVSSSAARAAIPANATSIEWSVFIDGDVRVIHLRDGCPCLPFAGRRIQGLPTSIQTDHGSIPVRVPPARGGLWELVSTDPSVRNTILTARRELPRVFSAAIGRTATVNDIPMLGRDVAIPLYTKPVATDTTPLDQILL